MDEFENSFALWNFAILFYQPLFYEPISNAATKILIGGMTNEGVGAHSAGKRSSGSTIYSTCSYLFIPVKQIPEDKFHVEAPCGM